MNHETQFIKTDRLTVAYHRAGRPGLPRLLLLHGDCSSSLFYLPLMARLEEEFDMVAPDLRCFGETEPLPIDAKRGLRDYADDLESFVRAIGWDDFNLAGWSMGGGVSMQYVMDHPERVERLILIAPLSPYGFGGTYGVDGKLLQPEGIACGGGTVTPALIHALQIGDRGFAALSISRTYVRQTYLIPPDRMELFIDGFLSTKLGEGRYPGDYTPTLLWPFTMAGTRGVNNAMAPMYCNLSGIADMKEKPPILWVRGDQDVVICDGSICDVCHLGRIGMSPGYPGEAFYPPQPMLSQTRAVLDRYRENGGVVDEVVMHSGHGPFIDDEDGFVKALRAFFEKRR